MCRRPRLLLLGVPLLLAFAPAPKHAKEDDAKAMQGGWKITRMEHDGMPEREAKMAVSKAVIKGNRLEVHEGKRVEAVTFVLDAKKKPKEINLTIDRPPAVGPAPAVPPPPPKDLNIVGIYKLEKDTLTLCFAAPGSARPKEFVTKPGSNHAMIVFQRVKP